MTVCLFIRNATRLIIPLNYLAEIEANQEDDAEALLSAQQEADFKKAVENCNSKFDEISEIVQDNL